MLGDIDDLFHHPSDNRGMTPRIFEYLFARILKVYLSYLHRTVWFAHFVIKNFAFIDQVEDICWALWSGWNP